MELEIPRGTGEGLSKAQKFKEIEEVKLEFTERLGGGGTWKKFLPWEEYDNFLELHILITVHLNVVSATPDSHK